MAKTATVRAINVRAQGERVDLAGFAFRIGSAERLARDASEPFAEEYAAGDKKHRGAMRGVWVENYVMGRVGCKLEEARRIIKMKRTEREAHDQRHSTEWEKSVNAGSKKFEYHVIRDSKEGGNARKEAEVFVVSRGMRSAFKSFVTECGDLDTAKKIFKQLTA